MEQTVDGERSGVKEEEDREDEMLVRVGFHGYFIFYVLLLNQFFLAYHMNFLILARKL